MINYSIDTDGIATIEWDIPDRAQNVFSEQSFFAWTAAMERALNDASIRGVLITSGKKDFIAGGDLEQLFKLQDREEVLRWGRLFNEVCRRFETGNKPLACAMPGSALGGGFELALICHYRVAADNPKARFGLPEVNLGLLPGGGGTQRLARLLGYVVATPLLTEGKLLKAETALALGLLDAVVPAGSERAQAKAWLLSPSSKNALQPWDRDGYVIPGGSVNTSEGEEFFEAARLKIDATAAINAFAASHILSCIQEGLSTDINEGLLIECQHLAALVTSPEAKQLIASFLHGEKNLKIS
jgi:3-hydroxyacyl-CoA dehydrogenase/enoyl-CoA hydratase/3-hydroxybutyryl-CoA epimerase